MKAEFDGCAAGYSGDVERAVAFAGQEHAFYLDAKMRQIVEGVRSRLGGPASTLRALEVGCGTGLMQDRLRPSCGRLCGVDISVASLARAGPADRVHLAAADGRRLPFADGAFDLVFAVCLLHHLAPAARDATIAEIARLTRPGGLVAIGEHNPWNPLTRRVVASCPFDRDAVLLPLAQTRRLLRSAGLSSIWHRYFLFFPWRGRAWVDAERLLARVPLGAQYVVFGSKA
jgi:SAM-dependent methyltransferase